MTPRLRRAALILCPAMFALAACAPASDDPAQGGLINGISGLSSGNYQARVDDKQATVAAETARQEQLQAQLAALQKNHQDARLALASRRARLASQGVAVPAELDQKVTAALQTQPGGSSDAEKLARLRSAIADARALTEQLASLSG